jgi:hypothetical protein
MSSVEPMLVQKARQKCAVKRGSRSLMMRSGMPWCRTTVSRKSRANAGALIAVLHAA